MYIAYDQHKSHMYIVFTVFIGKLQMGFGTGYMDRYPIITRVMFFIIKNDRSIKWWILNVPDVWDVMQPVIDLLATMIKWGQLS